MPLSVVALNVGNYDAAFAPICALGAARVRIVHAQYRSSWAEVSARRSGTGALQAEELSDDLRAALAQADVVFGFVVPRSLRELAPRLRWVHTPATGIDHLRGTGVLESDIVITTVGGLFAPVIAELVVAAMLHFAKRVPRFEQQRRERLWKMTRIASLANRTVGLIGVGSIGAAVAQLAKAFGMHVIGVGRSDVRGRQIAGVDRVLPRTELPQLLAAADYVVIAVADTPETRQMLGPAELAMMKREAVLINVARGTVVDESALIAALQTEQITGAALDVFEQEPLPADSPLWALANVLLTPHIAASVPDYLPRAIALFADNVRRHLDGEPLLNQFDRARGY